ncbi:MAG: energy transducer TonB [Zoogloea sp.]|nr:energy transducer TonB [Zoogloea sp.]
MPPAPFGQGPVSPPRFDAAYLDNPPPAYPASARRNGEEGRVLLRVHVTTGGRADEIQVQSGSGSESLDQAARAAVRRWRFEPARQGGQAVVAWVLVPIVFKLDD